MLYNDHLGSEPGALNYAPAPRFTISPSPDFAGQFLYRANTELETARIAIDRISYAADRANAFGATDDQLEDLKNAARDVERALADAIAKLTRAA